MITILHGSDVHFGKHHEPRSAAAFLEMARDLNPDVIVISGDLTQRAKVGEYLAARAYLDRLPDVPVVVTPGNHDVPLYRFWERALAPLRNYRNFIGPELDTVTKIPGAVIVALSSVAPYTAIVNGRIRDHQLEFARRAFQEAGPEDARIAVIHHNLVPAPDYVRDRPVPGNGPILNHLAQMGVELLLGGHLHRAFVSTSRDAGPTPAPLPGILVVMSGTTSSTRGRGPESGRQSLNVVRVGSDRIRITQFLFAPAQDRFVPVRDHGLPRDLTGPLPEDMGLGTVQRLSGRGAP
jgi:3',5'-cyclic AMP phosphodiesterase CpdA